MPNDVTEGTTGIDCAGACGPPTLPLAFDKTPLPRPDPSFVNPADRHRRFGAADPRPARVASDADRAGAPTARASASRRERHARATRQVVLSDRSARRCPADGRRVVGWCPAGHVRRRSRD